MPHTPTSLSSLTWLKLRAMWADSYGDMDQRAPVKQAGPKVTPERLRDQFLAADLDMVSAWAEALVRTVEAHRLPTREEDVLQRLADDLDLRTQACLRQLGDLTIAVGESHLSFAGNVVYHTATEKESIPAALYYAGVQQLTLRQGVESGELRALVNILRSASDEGEQCSDDAVTLLWDQSLQRIDWSVVSGPSLPWAAPPRGITGFHGRAGTRTLATRRSRAGTPRDGPTTGRSA